jgi:hypothetical protein
MHRWIKINVGMCKLSNKDNKDKKRKKKKKKKNKQSKINNSQGGYLKES